MRRSVEFFPYSGDSLESRMGVRSRRAPTLARRREAAQHPGGANLFTKRANDLEPSRRAAGAARTARSSCRDLSHRSRPGQATGTSPDGRKQMEEGLTASGGCVPRKQRWSDWIRQRSPRCFRQLHSPAVPAIIHSQPTAFATVLSVTPNLAATARLLMPSWRS